MQPERLRVRILTWADEEVRLGALPPKSGKILEAVLYRGELPRSDAADIVGTGAARPAHGVRACREGRAGVGQPSRAPPPRLSRYAGLALDAGTVS